MSQGVLEGVSGVSAEPLFGWPGSKRRLRDRVLARLGPPGKGDAGTLVSPFIGGGAVELMAAARGWKVYGSDLNRDLAHLWAMLLGDSEPLVRIMGVCAKKDKVVMGRWVEQLDTRPDNDSWRENRAISLFLRLRSCLYHTPNSKTLEVNGRTGKETWRANIGPRWQEEVRRFNAPGLWVSGMPFDVALLCRPRGAVYCDPPYVEERKDVDYAGLYNGMTVDHDVLADRLLDRDTRWVLSINDCRWARERFEGQPGVGLEEVRLTWRLGTRDGSKARKMGELLLFRG